MPTNTEDDIFCAQLYAEYKNEISNPLIITDITALSAFVLDYLCYATITLPTEDITKILLIKDNQGLSVKQAIIQNYGEEAIDYITKVVDDINGSLFRTSVYNGLLIE